MRKKTIFTLITLFYYIFIINTYYIFPERIDILKVRADNFKKELNLNDEQTEKFYKILQEEKRINKSKVYNFKGQTIQEIIQKGKKDYNYIQKMIQEILTDEQYEKYLSIKSSYIDNELSLYLIKELNLNHQQAVELDIIASLIYTKLKYLIPKKTINQFPDSKKNQKNIEIILANLIVLEKEINSKLNPEQLQNYKEKKYNINIYILINFFGIENFTNPNN